MYNVIRRFGTFIILTFNTKQTQSEGFLYLQEYKKNVFRNPIAVFGDISIQMKPQRKKQSITQELETGGLLLNSALH